MKNYVKTMITICVLVITFTATFGLNDKDENKLKANYAVYQEKKTHVINLVYQPSGQVVKVRIFDPSGNLILKDVIKSKKLKDDTFIRPYNFKSLRSGNYIFEISEGDKMLHHLVEYRKNSRRPGKQLAPVSVVALQDGKYKVVVSERPSSDVEVKIISTENHLIFNEAIKEVVEFSKVYDLSKLAHDSYYIKVKVNKKEYTKRIWM